MNRYYAEGYAAGMQGKSIADAPYKVGTPECGLWVDGWLAAEEDQARGYDQAEDE